MANLRSYLLIYLSFFIALVLYILPLPIAISATRPSFLLLLVFYWVLALPQKVGVMHACFLGLIVDILLGSTLGVNALLLSLVSYFVTSYYQKIRNFNMAKTTITIGILVFVDYLFLYWIASSERNIVLHDYYFIPLLTSMLIWPWFFLLMRFARTKFKV